MDLDKMKGFDLTPFTSATHTLAYKKRIQEWKFDMNPAANKTASKKRWSTLAKALDWLISATFLYDRAHETKVILARPTSMFREYETIEHNLGNGSPGPWPKSLTR